LRIGLDAIGNASAIDRSLVKQTRSGEKDFYILRIGYPLSESVAPPGTAWGAEGLRGNEANENKLMVLAPARARKGQSGRTFAQQGHDSQGFGFRASG
jgi:hypothetical protein